MSDEEGEMREQCCGMREDGCGMMRCKEEG